MALSFWVPEHPKQPLYRAKHPTKVGGEREMLVTASVQEALQFSTRAECEAWITANPRPRFVAREHQIQIVSSGGA